MRQAENYHLLVDVTRVLSHGTECLLYDRYRLWMIRQIDDPVSSAAPSELHGHCANAATVVNGENDSSRQWNTRLWSPEYTLVTIVQEVQNARRAPG